jgi:CubicO group peptidase (beta-lactamase class C family)
MRKIGLGLTILVLTAGSIAHGEDGAVEARIERVVGGLLPETSLPGRYGAPGALHDRMAYFHTPGVSIAVLKDGQIDWARGFGVRDAETREPVTTETVFEAGSVSKPVFALLVMKLVNEGKLDLDRDVNRYLKSWKVSSATEGFQPEIHLRQLLSHSAGLTVHGFPGYLRSETLPTLPQVLSGEPPSNTPRVETNILPGVQFRYSGGGTTVAQLLVEDVTGKKLPELARDAIFEPLGLRDSTYEQPLPEAWHRRASTAHPWKGIAVKGKWHVYPEMAAAGLWTTPSDLARIGIELQRTLRGESSRLLPRERLEEMLTPQVPEQKDRKRVGIGFFLQGRGDTARFGHDGWDEGFVTRTSFYQNAGLGAVVMVNSNEGAPLIDEVERAIAREYEWPGYFEPEESVVTLPRKTLRSLAGEYRSKAGTRFVVVAKAGALLFGVAGQPPAEIVPSSESEFFSRDLDLVVAFTLGDRSTTFVLRQSGTEVSAEKR